MIKATNEVGTLLAFKQHSGDDCKKTTANQEHQCIYAILVNSTATDFQDHTHFSLLAHHNETTHV
eukprot:CAMPEP_0168346850 /NCGR_PEP_ID=MMETSP0213-20121227/18575_1 /TAXON_ID=151035 /ORGANISM="Euplotes harpa, Strain FSP1.4" /LENGTH=64 /DNA_ID=CAMNT_0008355697 /DNA_START=66 /DNA_END=256 /DNA_ORIENTATION=-